MTEEQSPHAWLKMAEDLERIEGVIEEELRRLQLAAVILASSGELPDVADAARNLIRKSAGNMDAMTVAVSSAVQAMIKTAGIPIREYDPRC